MTTSTSASLLEAESGTSTTSTSTGAPERSSVAAKTSSAAESSATSSPQGLKPAFTSGRGTEISPGSWTHERIYDLARQVSRVGVFSPDKRDDAQSALYLRGVSVVRRYPDVKRKALWQAMMWELGDLHRKEVAEIDAIPIEIITERIKAGGSQNGDLLGALDVLAGTESDMVAADQRLWLGSLAKRLPSRYLVVLLGVSAGLQIDEIAANLGESVCAVKCRLHRARQLAKAVLA